MRECFQPLDTMKFTGTLFILGDGDDPVVGNDYAVHDMIKVSLLLLLILLFTLLLLMLLLLFLLLISII